MRNPDADDLLRTKGKEVQRDKLILLVMNKTGYENIMKLMKRFYLDNTANGDDPQLKYRDLEELNEGLIALTAGVDGAIGRLLLENRAAEAEQILQKLLQIFGKDNRLYMEIARIGLPEEQQTEQAFLDLAYKYNVPLVATNEVFFFDVCPFCPDLERASTCGIYLLHLSSVEQYLTACGKIGGGEGRDYVVPGIFEVFYRSAADLFEVKAAYVACHADGDAQIGVD